MSTRSFIIDKVSNRGIYCHFDGYPEHQIPILKGCYNTQEKVDELINLGDILCLGQEIEFKKIPNYSDSLTLFTDAYHRDKGEEWDSVKPMENCYPLIEIRCAKRWIEYIYI